MNHWDLALFFSSLTLPCVAGLVLEYVQRRRAASRTGGDPYYAQQEGEDAGDSLHRFLGSRSADEPPEGTTLGNLLSGAASAVSCLPQAVSFALIAGVSPLSGVWAGMFMSLSSALVGGRPGLISCSSASTAVILVDVTQDPRLGLGGMALVVLICGGLQGAFAALRLSRFVSLVPHTVLLGFVNGLSVCIAREQVDQFRTAGPGSAFLEEELMQGMFLTALVSLAVAWLFPRLPIVGRLLPAPFVAIAAAITFSVLMSPWFPERTLGHRAGADAFNGGLDVLPPWDFPPLEVDYGSGHVWKVAFVAGARMAIVGLVESLATLMLVDIITETRGSTSSECFAQSLGNILCGIFGVQGGSALIGQTLINVGGGGRGRLSGLTVAVGFFIGAALLGPLVSRIPVAAVVGLMVLVALRTFAWGSLGLLRRSMMQASDGLVVLLVTLVTVFQDLATAIILGLVVSALIFAWNVSSNVRLEVSVDAALNRRSFCLHGPLFFASSASFQAMVDVTKIPEVKVALDFSSGHVLDYSALEAVTKVAGGLKESGKRVEIFGLNPEAQDHVYNETGIISL